MKQQENVLKASKVKVFHLYNNVIFCVIILL